MKFNEYQKKSQETWIINGEYDFIRTILGLCGETGEIADKLKKHYRGDKKVTREEIEKELGDVLYYVARIADYYHLNLEDVAINNIKKLQDRKERGKLKGNGDNR